MQQGLCNGTVSVRLTDLSTAAAGLLLCARREADRWIAAAAERRSSTALSSNAGSATEPAAVDAEQRLVYSFVFSCVHIGWWRGTVVERRSLTGELSLSCARPAADG